MAKETVKDEKEELKSVKTETENIDNTTKKAEGKTKLEIKEMYLQGKNISKSKKLKRLTKKEKKDLGLVDNRQTRAVLKYARISARKVKIVGDLIKGKNVVDALRILKLTPKAASPILEKLLNSAIANAENNNSLDKENLYVSDLYANQGPTLKRIMPRAQGRANRIRKRTSHITVVVREVNN